MHGRMLTILLLVIPVLLVVACTDQSKTGRSAEGYRTVETNPRRDTDAAKHANQLGLQQLEKGQIDEAARSFELALTADVEFGPAHNNLGKIYFKKKDWYKAAWEFEYARKLLPRYAEPCNNLGLVFEETGEIDRAVDSYRQATALDGNNIQYRANLARAMIRRGERTDEVKSLLQQIIEQDTRPDWLIWARQQQATLGRQGK